MERPRIVADRVQTGIASASVTEAAPEPARPPEEMRRRIEP